MRKKDYPKKIKINFISQWTKFKNYSLVEFFQLMQENNPELMELKNKIVLVGISDINYLQYLKQTLTNNYQVLRCMLLH